MQVTWRGEAVVIVPDWLMKTHIFFVQALPGFVVVDEDAEATVEAEPADTGGFQSDSAEGGGGGEDSPTKMAVKALSIDKMSDKRVERTASRRGVVRVNSTMTSEFSWVFASPGMRKLRLFFKHYVLLGVIMMQVR